MKPIAFLFCEGSEAKLALINKEKDGTIKVYGVSSSFVDVSLRDFDKPISLPIKEEVIEFEQTNFQSTEVLQDENNVKIISLSNAIVQSKIKKFDFVPILTEPNIFYYVYEGAIYEKKQYSLESLIDDISKSRNIKIEKGSIDFVEISDDRLLAVVIDGEVECLPLIKSVSNYVGKDQPNIKIIKAAEISLAYYIGKFYNLNEDEHSIIVYVGKEYSKLIFLKGKQIIHLGSTLDVGTTNVHTYDVYFSKILLEMETGNIAIINKIIVCGEDVSENLILSFYGTFPDAEIVRLEFNSLDLTLLNETDKLKISSYSIPIAAAIDYYDSLDNKYQGINLLPRQIIEERKFFQFSWHSLAILPLLFFVTLFFTIKILERKNEINLISNQIIQKEEIIKNNQAVLEQIQLLENKINNFGIISAKLDTLSVGRALLTVVSEKIASFSEKKKNF